MVGIAAALLVLSACSTDPGPPTADRRPSPTTQPEASTVPEPTATPEPSRTPGPAPDPALDARLIDAAWDADVARARRLIRAGADVNAQDETRQSAFLIATSEGPLELLELTLRHGADVDAHPAAFVDRDFDVGMGLAGVAHVPLAERRRCDAEREQDGAMPGFFASEGHVTASGPVRCRRAPDHDRAASGSRSAPTFRTKPISSSICRSQC